MTTYLVNEVYSCLQGEGFNLGKPSVLVRFQICNLRCSWCDTPYTHTLKSDADLLGKQKFNRFELPQLVELIQKSGNDIKHVILTGGEPTLQNLKPLRDELGQDYTVEVESNGTQIPHLKFESFLYEDYRNFQWNISPKGNSAGEKIDENSLAHWADLSKIQNSVFFKFVIRSEFLETDIQEVLEIQNKYRLIGDRLYLMPEGTHAESQLGCKELHDVCLKYGFRYTPRLHVLLFGAQRGV